MRARPIAFAHLIAELTELLDHRAHEPWTGVAVDGHPEAGTAGLADALVDPLRVRGRQALRVDMYDYLRPASLRLEHGHRDPDSFYREWFDYEGLRREVLRPLEPGGHGRILRALWDAERDRSPRLPRERLAPGGLVLVHGPMLLGRGLGFDIGVHLRLSEKVLGRKVPAEHAWQLPAFRRYEHDHRPELAADFVVRMDTPDRPAIVDAV